jgi:glucokinase
MRIGLDIGGTKTLGVAVDADGRIAAQVRRPTGWGSEAVVATAVDVVGMLARECDLEFRALRSVGMGIPGQIEPGSGTVVHAVNLGVDRLDLAAALEPLLGMPVAVENDVKAAALGAYSLQGASGAMGYLNLGTGVAAGIVTGEGLWRGSRGAAGEVGHISVDPRGPLCRCGQRGCIEALAGGGAIAERWARPGALPVRDVFDAADGGDRAAEALRTGLAHGVAAAVRVLVLTADVDVVVLGGGLTALGERLVAPVRVELARSAEASAFMRSLRLDERLTLLPPGSPAAALGAALIGAASAPEEALAHG